jgi:hypothetical protein
MTDRLKGFIVTLEDDFRTDDAEAIISAIQMVRHVQSVEPIVADYNDHMARERVRSEFRDKLWAVLYPEYAKKKE